ncbi:CDP-diacylglycerol--inositol 3-phosphatidyltransferase isoform X3 [Mobula hypostoma]|uniref:CDP-diacylglycerol--inositol 3-phosphatidyltransferase isoform X3 n=1 Tax=Mobula hypostoma TaxID=723540 RepID=UPI002FC2A5F2
MRWRVFFYVPNLIGYVRLVLLLVGWWSFNHPVWFISCYVTSIILDGFDGFAARRLNQVSEFGAWFDVAIDNIGRSMLWSLLYDWGHFISSLEWLVFVCTHGSMGGDWKKKFQNSPWFVRKTMSNAPGQPQGRVACCRLGKQPSALPNWGISLCGCCVMYPTPPK